MEQPSFPLWRFSVRAYRAPGAAQACLALQDSCDVDVNLLLYAGWLGALGRRLDARALRRAAAAAGRWQAGVVRPLRQARRAIKKTAALTAESRLRKSIAALELNAEYLEQRRLAALPLPHRIHPPAAAIGANLERYLELLGVKIGPRERRHLEAVTRACLATPAEAQ